MWNTISTSLPQILEAGFKYTIPLALISFFIGLALALVTALIRLSATKGINIVIKLFLDFMYGCFVQHHC